MSQENITIQNLKPAHTSRFSKATLVEDTLKITSWQLENETTSCSNGDM
jgi:hypothetical protein